MALYLVPTPIGNLGDVTLRSIDILKSVDAILCEDTRTSSKFLNHYGILQSLIPYHQHNEHKIVNSLVEDLKAGKSFALITDAGTPGISDPGFLIVRACRQAGYDEIYCLPGANAFVPALVQSGLPANKFIFEGFLPIKKGRQTAWLQIAEADKTTILYESPHRLMKTLTDIQTFCGTQRWIAVARELTKLHEEITVNTVENVLKHYQQKTAIKGELVVLIAPKDYLPHTALDAGENSLEEA